jgi:hypothetical protein
VDSALYRVEDDFPRITPDVFAGGVPGGVEEVGYTINLSGFDTLIYARDPGAWVL